MVGEEVTDGCSGRMLEDGFLKATLRDFRRSLGGLLTQQASAHASDPILPDSESQQRYFG